MLPSDLCPVDNHFKFHKVLVLKIKNFVNYMYALTMLEYLAEIYHGFLTL